MKPKSNDHYNVSLKVRLDSKLVTVTNGNNADPFRALVDIV